MYVCVRESAFALWQCKLRRWARIDLQWCSAASCQPFRLCRPLPWRPPQLSRLSPTLQQLYILNRQSAAFIFLIFSSTTAVAAAVCFFFCRCTDGWGRRERSSGRRLSGWFYRRVWLLLTWEVEFRVNCVRLERIERVFHCREKRVYIYGCPYVYIRALTR